MFNLLGGLSFSVEIKSLYDLKKVLFHLMSLDVLFKEHNLIQLFRPKRE